MAGLGRKVFTAGEVLEASEVNGYLMDQTVMVFAGTAERTAAIGTPTEGMVTYLQSDNTTTVWTGAAWEPLGGGAGGFENSLLLMGG